MNLYRRFVTMLVVFALMGAGWPNVRPTPAHAAGPWYVAPGGNDSNSCLSAGSPCATMNGAIGMASSGDTIYVATGVYTSSVGSPVVLIDKSVTLSGGWNLGFTTQNGLTTIDGENARQGITVWASAIMEFFVIQHGVGDSGAGIYNTSTLVLNNSSVSNNTSSSLYATGGGIYNGGTLTLNNSLVSGNSARNCSGNCQGGGIFNNGTLILNNSTISGNTAQNGGGIDNYFGALTLNNSTVSGNIAQGGGGILSVYATTTIQNSTISSNMANSGGGLSGDATLQNSLVAGNMAQTGPDCSGSPTLVAYNLIGNTADCTFIPGTGNLTNINADLGSLIGWPGYRPLLSGSPAIDAGSSATPGSGGNACEVTDQRGAPRVGRCDIGAYEYTPAGPAAGISTFAGTPQYAPPSTAFAIPLQALVVDSLGSPVVSATVTFTAPASGASGVFANSGTSTTTALATESGLAATATFIANELTGTYTITATVSGVVTPATFLMSNVEVWYVTPDGSDSNTCLSPAAACATINSTLGKISPNDAIYVATGTYTSSSGTEVVLLDKNAILSGGWDSTFTTSSGASTIDGQGVRQGIVNSGVTAIVERFFIQNSSVDYSGSLSVYSGGTLTLSNSTVSGNPNGGIVNGGTLILNNSTVSGNTAANGGGIFNNGSLTVNNSTINGNVATRGGGLYNSNGLVRLNNSTISGNTSQYSGGIENASGIVTMQNSLLADNTSTDGSTPDCNYTIASTGYNLIGNTLGCSFTPGVGDLTNVNANLGELIGFPGYHPLLLGSPAINAGHPAGCADHLGNPLTADQRGALRVGICDIGAYEYTLPGPAASIAVVSGSPQHAPPLTAFAQPLRAVVLDSIGTPVSNTLVSFTAPTSGASGTFAESGTSTTTATTNAGGIASSATFIANDMPGAYIVTATVSGIITPINYLLSNLAWYVTSIGNDDNDCQTPATACASINGTLAKNDFLESDLIFVATGTYTRSTGNEVVLLDKSATLSGGWDTTFTTQADASTLDGEAARRGIRINNGVVAIIEHFTILNGYDDPGGDEGGGISNSGMLTLTHSTIIGSNNLFGTGTGIINDYGNLVISDSVINDNTGGGISSNFGTLTLSNSTISNNGGWGIQSNGSTLITNSTISGNVESGASGGGISNDGLMTVTNSTVNGNTGYSGIANNGNGNLTLSNSTISGNQGYFTGGIINYGPTVVLHNTILAGNSNTPVNNPSPDCYVASGVISSTGYNLIGNTTGCAFTNATGDLLNVDAKLWPALVGSPGVRPLLSGSPAIDAGNPTGCRDHLGNLLTTDQRGVARVGRCDIGAYEYDSANDPLTYVFLPLVRRSKLRPGINGIVTENGAPAPGVTLNLRFYNGSSWSTLTSTTTDADGDYFFTGIPSLGPGQRYYVRYQNTSTGGNPNRLWTWHTQSLTSYTAGSNVAIGNFDLANITLISPADGANVSVPHTFQWTPRPATPSDVYEFDLYDPYDFNPGFYPIVGYVGSYTLNSLPPGFGAGPLYVWEVWVYSPDGGFGISYETRVVYFSNTGLARAESLDLSEQSERPADVRRHPELMSPNLRQQLRD